MLIIPLYVTHSKELVPGAWGKHTHNVEVAMGQLFHHKTYKC
jgi:hypothetical protein